MLQAPEKGPQGLSQGCTYSDPCEWSFLQCFGERTPGEEVQEGESWAVGAKLLFGPNAAQLGTWAVRERNRACYTPVTRQRTLPGRVCAAQPALHCALVFASCPCPLIRCL